MLSRRLTLAAGVLLVAVLAAGSPVRAETQPDSTAEPIILSPEDGAEVPRDGIDPPCPPQGPCPKVLLKGRVSEGLWPFIGVAPLSASPKIWIQPTVAFVKKSGGIETVIFVGSERDGAGERFHVFLFACAEKDRFHRGEVLTGVPDDCQVGEPVSLFRTK